MPLIKYDHRAAAAAKSKGKIVKDHKHKHKSKHALWNPSGTFSYLIVPKGKRLTRRIVTKLEREGDGYNVARGIFSAKKLQSALEREGVDTHVSSENRALERPLRSARHTPEDLERIRRIRKRAEKRRARKENVEREELRRKFYRVHPDDVYHSYLPGYQRARHRITKKRFMKCVDVQLLKEVLQESVELNNSLLWEAKTNPKVMTVDEAHRMKDDLNRFDVIVEALKQGVFNKPGCDNLPIAKVRRKKKYQNLETDTKKLKPLNKKRRRRSERLSIDATLAADFKRRLSFPPFEDSDHSIPEAGTTKNINTKPAPAKNPTPSKSEALTNLRKPKTKLVEIKVVNELEKFESDSSSSEQEVDNLSVESEKPELQPFADFLTIKVPIELAKRKKLIATLAMKKNKSKLK